MKCLNCGTELNEEANFCPICGSAIKKKRRKSMLFIVPLFIIVGVVIAFATVLLQYDQEKEVDERDIIKTSREESASYVSGFLKTGHHYYKSKTGNLTTIKKYDRTSLVDEITVGGDIQGFPFENDEYYFLLTEDELILYSKEDNRQDTIYESNSDIEEIRIYGASERRLIFCLCTKSETENEKQYYKSVDIYSYDFSTKQTKKLNKEPACYYLISSHEDDLYYISLDRDLRKITLLGQDKKFITDISEGSEISSIYQDGKHMYVSGYKIGIVKVNLENKRTITVYEPKNDIKEIIGIQQVSGNVIYAYRNCVDTVPKINTISDSTDWGCIKLNSNEFECFEKLEGYSYSPSFVNGRAVMVIGDHYSSNKQNNFVAIKMTDVGGTRLYNIEEIDSYRNSDCFNGGFWGAIGYNGAFVDTDGYLIIKKDMIDTYYIKLEGK